MNIVARWCGRASGSVTAITIRKSAIEPLRGEPLVPGDHVVVAVAHGARLQLRRVAAGGLGLGHREGRFEVAGEQRLEPALLLLGRAGQREDLGVARVRRLAAERIGRERRGAQDLVHQPELHLAEPLPPELGIEVRRPQAALPHLLLQRGVDAVEPRLVELSDNRLQRPDLLAHEGAHPVELLLELRFGREIPRHRGLRSSHTVRAEARTLGG